MCGDCWHGRGAPALRSPSIDRAAQLIDVLYHNSPVGEPFHCELDDWNVGTEHAFTEPYWGDDDTEPVFLWAAEELQALMLSMTEEERASALAMEEGFVPWPDDVQRLNPWIGPQVLEPSR